SVESCLMSRMGSAAAGIVLCATRVPIDIDGGETGGRTFSLSWLHEQMDQAGVVRDYVKWDYELRSAETIHQVVQRAFRIASSEPYGPVYLALPQDILARKIKEVRIPPVTRHSAVETPQVDNTLLEKMAAMLIEAQEPLIITGYSGRHTGGVEVLVELAEALGARVVSSQYMMNFPTNHPLSGGYSPDPYLNNADIILIIDHDVPYTPSRANLRTDAKIIHIDIDAVKRDLPMWGFPADILAECDSAKTLPLLSEAVQRKITPQDSARFRERFEKLQSEHKQMREQWRDSADSWSSEKPVSVDWLCRCLDEVIDENTIVIEEAVTNRMAVLRQIQRTKPGTFFTSEGSSLGWAPGAALGAKLASPDSTVVAIVGDGTFIFGCPVPTLWAAEACKAPFLCVIMNNARYNAPKRAIRSTYGEQSFSDKTGNFVGTDIVPPPDYAEIARACGAYGLTVEEPSEVKSVLSGALEQVRQGKMAVVDVRIQ
ncbi:thiamine pyrophosphate-requiring protein, partial [Chloroflexota bacterium]